MFFLKQQTFLVMLIGETWKKTKNNITRSFQKRRRYLHQQVFSKTGIYAKPIFFKNLYIALTI